MKDNTEPLIILGESIAPGTCRTIDFNIANLFTATKIEIPVIIERAKKPGPTVLITAGIHGDEINGIEIVRQLIARKINQPKRGTIICMPIINIFGFLNSERSFPDGRDLNRVFPGSKSGSLASRVAYRFTTDILPVVDYCLDFHTGGASRFNAAQIRIRPNDGNLLELAAIFNAPFTVLSTNLKKTYRGYCDKKGIPALLFEGGKSLSRNKSIVRYGVNGIMRFLAHLDMLAPKFEAPESENNTVIIKKTRWIRANHSGLLHPKVLINKYVEKGALLATITDPYGKMRYKVNAPCQGFIINVNQAPTVNQGDAVFHISTLDNAQNLANEIEDFDE
jgi:hypothetical protein